MTRARTPMVLLISTAVLLAGCGDSGAPAAPAAGKANLRVTAVAVPKSGAKVFRTYQSDAERAAAATQSTGDLELVDYEQLDDVVLWIEPAGGQASTAKPAVERRIPVADKRAHPPLFAVSVSDSAVFENKGSQRLRLYSVSEGNEFDLGQIQPGDVASHRFQSPGLVELLDGETFEVLARVYVVHAGGDPRVTHSSEPVTFRDLNPGPWRASAWHERLPGSERTITLVADGVREIDVPIGVNTLPKVE
jgi:hypothetical protein